MKKTYQTPQFAVIEIRLDGRLCDASAQGSVDSSSISNEGNENMVKSNNYKTNSVEWEDWK